MQPPRLRALSPFGPIFGKELRVASRRKRNHILRVAYLAALLLILTMAYATIGDIGGSGVAAQADRQSRLGFTFFVAFTYFSIIAMLLVGPVLTSTAIGAERTHKTLHVLLMTPMTAWQIVAGKLASRLFLAFALLALSLPVLALVRLLGGVELWQMGAALLLAATSGAFAAAMGLWLSTLISRPYAVILAAYGLLGVVYLFVPFVLIMVMQLVGAWSLMWWQGIFNPVYSATVLVWGGAGMRGGPPWWWGAIVHVAAAGLLLLLAARALRKQQLKEGEAEKGVTNVGYTLEPIDRATATPEGVEPPSASPTARDVSDNPIAWRELRQPMLPRGWLRVVVRIAAGLVLGTVYALTALNDGLDDEETHIGFSVLFNAGFWLLAAVLSATAIAQEKESDTWTLLLATPLRARSIVLGKFAGLAWRLRWPVAIAAAHFLIFALFGVVAWSSALLVLLVLLSFNSLWIATGLYLSLRVPKVTVAVVINLSLAVMLYLVLLLAELATRELFNSWPRGGPYALLVIPYYYLGHVIYILSPDYHGFRALDVPGSNGQLGRVGLILMTVAACAAYLLASSAIVAWTVVRFDKVVGRARQTAPPPPREDRPPRGAGVELMNP